MDSPDTNRTMLAVRDQRRSKALYAFVTFCIFSYPFYASNLLPMTLSLAMAFFGFLIVTCLFLKEGSISFSHSGWFNAWILVAMIAALSAALSGYSYDFTHMWYPSVYVMSILIMLMCSRTTKWITTAVKTIIIMLLPFAIGTIVLYFVPDLFDPVKRLLFPDSFFATGYQSGLTTHYSYNGTYNTVGFLISSGLFLFQKRSRKSNRLWLAIMVIFVFALMLIGKRQNIVFGAFAIFAVYAISGNRGKTFKIALALAALLAILELAISYVPGIAASFDRLFDTFETTDVSESTNGRAFIWESAIRGWGDNPLFGHGWGIFSYQFSANNTVHVAHNELLNLLYETGVIGAAATTFCALFSLVITWITFRSSSRDESGGKDLPSYGAALGVSLLIQIYMILMGYTIGSLFSGPSSFMPYFFAVSITIACRWSLRQSEQLPSFEKSRHPECRLKQG